MTDAQLRQSYDHCRTIAKTRAKNFYYSFIVLPPERRRAMHAVYAFMRYCDDMVDEAGTPTEKRVRIDRWRQALAEVYAAQNSVDHPILPAFCDTVTRFGIPRDYFDAIIEGTEMDLTVTRYRTFDELYRYCYRVASAVGLVCICIFGFTDEQAKQYAESCGIAFQLTNILRDIPEDAAMGRIYLPQEDLQRFAYTEEDIRNGVIDDRFIRLMEFEVNRAHRYYKEALPLLPLIDASSRACLAAMIRIYWRNLDEIERCGYNVFERKIRLPAWKKLTIAAQALIQKQV